MRDFRFGFTMGKLSELRQTCEAADTYGYDVATAVDHLEPGRTSPFLGLLEVAHMSDRLSLATYILNMGFWEPNLVVRDVATMQRITGNRFELGLGAGIIKAEFDDAGFPFNSLPGRFKKIAEMIDALDVRMADETDVARPHILVGGSSHEALRLVAERGDIASFGGQLQVPDRAPGTLRLMTAEETDERVAYLRKVAGSRMDEIELNAFVLYVEVTDNRRAAFEAIAAETEGGDWLLMPDIDAALNSPFALVGTEEEIARQMLANRERYGFTYISVQRPHMHALGPSIKRVRDLAGE
jgi:probable F420-dependent oxidoreductase